MQITDRQLTSHLKSNQLSPIYLVCGDVPLLAQETIDKIRQAAQQAGYTQRELFFVDHASEWQRVQHSVENFGLFAEKTFIEIRHSKTKLDEAGIHVLSNYLQNPPSDKCLLLVTDKLSAVQQKSSWCQLINQHGLMVTLKAVLRHELPQWINERLRQANLKADNESVQLLAELTEGNLLATQQAIEKLRLLDPQQLIDKRAVVTIIHDNAQFTIFDLTHYALVGAAMRTSQVLQGLHFAGTEATLVLWALTRELRLLYELALEKQRGKPLTQLLATQWASRKIILQKALSRLSVTAVHRLLQMTEKIDRMIKGLKPGNPWQSLETLCLKLAGAAMINEIYDE